MTARSRWPTPGTKGAAAFWEWLFASMASHGLATYKLDHSQQQQPEMKLLLQNVGFTEAWLREMAEAAARHGISKQYGGPAVAHQKAAATARARGRA